MQTAKEELILIIDDHISALVIRQCFGELGYNTDLAENAKIALAKILLKKHALIVSDIDLPDAKGDDITKYIRQTTNPNQQTQMFGVTAMLTAERQKKCLSAGMVTVFEKPISNDIVKKILQMATLAI